MVYEAHVGLAVDRNLTEVEWTNRALWIGRKIWGGCGNL